MRRAARLGMYLFMRRVLITSVCSFYVLHYAKTNSDCDLSVREIIARIQRNQDQFLSKVRPPPPLLLTIRPLVS